MKRFRFPLQALLTVRQRHEHETMERYAQALLQRQQVAEHLDRIQRALSDAWEQLREQMARGCSAAGLAQARAYSTHLETLRDEYTTALGAAERRVHQTLQDMLRARREREVVETYGARQKARHDRQHQRLEHWQMDEFAARLAHPILPGRRPLYES
jgi:flagellar export protein FliJ